MTTGVLPKQILRQLLEKGFIKGVAASYLNPASLDLPCSDECYRLKRTFFIGRGETVRSKIEAAGGTRYDLRNPLERGMSYLIRLEGEFRLPPSVYGYANPKSSTGRIFALTRVVADGVRMFDALTPGGWQGELWVLVRPETFPIIVSPGKALTQVRLFDGKAFLDELALEMLLEDPGLFFTPEGQKLNKSDIDYHGNSFFFTVGLPPGNAGWECSTSPEVLDITKLDHNPEDFFRPVRVRNGRLDLQRGNYYILTTYEHLRVPADCAAELRAVDPRFGEFRSHSAGFFDPGWGLGDEVRGQPITLEITAYEDMTIEHGRTIARVRYERMKEVPEELYRSANSSYADQIEGPRLSKHFKR